MDILFLNLHDWSLPIRNPVFVMCILMLTVLTVPALLQRFKLPGIVGLILMGAILGPHGINLLEQGDGIKLLSKVGLLYIMFWAGLEIDMDSFVKNKHKSGLFGLLTFGLPFLFGLGLARFFFELNWLGSLLLAAMFATNTLVSYPIVNRLRISRNEAVSVAVGGTIITDILALVMLAVISGMAQGVVDGWFWLRLALSFGAFGAVVFGLLPSIARWFFRRVESDITNQFVFVLTMLFVSGLLAELAGIEAIIGAFLAGLVLNRLIPHSSPLMNRIEFVGNALFIPAFLFSVGMMINLHVFIENPHAITMALVLTGFALLSKWLAAFFTQKTFGYSTDQGNLIFGLTSSRAAATIAIALIGYQLKFFDEGIVNATIFLIMATCFVSSIFTDRVARRMASASIHAVGEAEKTQRILVSISNPASVVNLIDFAFLIKTPGKKEPVYPLSIILDEKDVRDKIRQSQQLIKPVVQHAAERQIALSPIHRVDVSAVSGILRAADELLATEIVIGWHPRVSTTERLFGTLLDNLLDESPEMLFVTNMVQSPFSFKKIRAIIAENAHLEPGFGDMVGRIENISLNLDLPLNLVISEAALPEAAKHFLKKTLDRLNVLPLDRGIWWQLHQDLPNDELLILLCARHESVSAESFMERIPSYLAEHFSERSFVLAYPAL